MEPFWEQMTMLFDSWVNLSSELKWAVALLVLAAFIYIFQTIKYQKLLGEKNTVHASISVRGTFLEIMGPGRMALALHAELFSITQVLEKIFGGRPAPYIAPATKRDTGYYLVGLRPEAQIPLLLPEQNFKIEQEIVLQLGSFSLPITQIMNSLLAICGILPVYGRKAYRNSLINISMVSGKSKTVLTVYGHKKSKENKNERKHGVLSPLWFWHIMSPSEYEYLRQQKMSVSSNSIPILLTVTKVTNDLDDLNGLIRDAAFMMLEILGNFGARSWRSMRELLDGLEALDKNRRSGCGDSRILAKECFRRAAGEDPINNYEALYYHGVMTMVDRTAESIDEAILHFEGAMKTGHKQLRALVHAGLAFCYAQKVHRLGKRNKFFLKQAYQHAKIAEKYWCQYQESEVRENHLKTRLHPLIPYTLALVNHVDESDENDRRERFFLAAHLYRKAINLEPDNGMFYNNLGWVLLKLAEWGELEIPENLDLDFDSEEAGLERNIPLLSEKYFQRSLGLCPCNKLTHANLCLLYSTEWFRKAATKDPYKDNEFYLAQSIYYGKKALSLDPNYINGYRDLAVALIRYDKLDEAYNFYKKALELAEDPDKDQEIIYDICSEYKKHRKERILKNAQLCRQEIDQKPDKGMNYYNVGSLLLKLAEWGELEIPENLDLDFDSEEAGLERNIPLLSEKYFHRSLELGVQNSNIHANLCLLYSTEWFRKEVGRNNLSRCLHHGQQALKLEPCCVNSHRNMTVGLVRYGKIEEAYDVYKRALGLAKDIEKDKEIFDDICPEIKELKDREEIHRLSKYENLDTWERPDSKLLEPRRLKD